MPANDNDAGSIGNPHKYEKQDYEVLRAACLKSGTAFSDPLFPADQTSIGMPQDPDPRKAVTWLRPKDISRNAVFVEGTTGTTDICQGQLGDCWLLAALSCLTVHPVLFAKVVPTEQSLSESYAGIFHFRFWQYGEWVDVVVDDRLPVREGRLLFSYSRTSNEFWSALVEKAYAKLIGSYSSLRGGNISEAMEDFTGGIARSLSVTARTPRVLWRALTATLSRGSLISCFIQATSVGQINTVTPEGLIIGHAYAITASNKVQKGTEEVLLLRLRNPWGFVEYCGPWSDKCDDWAGIDSAERSRIQLNKAEDGDFWIGVEDFAKLFDMVEVCNVDPDALSGGGAATSSWSLTSFHGSWVPMCSAGGSRRYRGTFWKNPQFLLILSERDIGDEGEDDDEDIADDSDDDEDAANEVIAVPERKTEKQRVKERKCTVLVELLQKDRRQRDRVNFLYVAFHIYRVPPELHDSVDSLDMRFFSTNRPVGRSGKYRNSRAVWREVHLDPGHYVIVASTYRPNTPGEFFLRIYAKKKNTLGGPDFTCNTSFLMAAPPRLDLPEDRMRVQKWFDREAESDDKLNAKELMKLANTVLESDYHLPLDICRQLIFLEDTGGRSRLSRDQAQKLLSSLRHLQSIFIQYDEDSSGTMSPFELNNALQAIGVQCNSGVQQVLWERFGAGQRHLSFPGFVACVTRLRGLFALYESESSMEVKKRGINAWLLRFLAV